MYENFYKCYIISHQTQMGIFQEIPWLHQERAQMGRNKWFKKDVKEDNRKGRIMMTATLEAAQTQSDFCLWRKKGYFQHKWLPPGCSSILERADRDYIVQYRAVESDALLGGVLASLPGTEKQESHSSRLPHVEFMDTSAPSPQGSHPDR